MYFLFIIGISAYKFIAENPQLKWTIIAGTTTLIVVCIACEIGSEGAATPLILPTLNATRLLLSLALGI